MPKNRKNRSRPGRATRRHTMPKIDTQLTAFTKKFLEIAYFDEEKLDWNIITKTEFEALDSKWVAFCKQKGYSVEMSQLFKLNIALIQTDLIMLEKYQAEAEKVPLYVMLRDGKTPLEVADYAKENFELTPVIR